MYFLQCSVINKLLSKLSLMYAGFVNDLFGNKTCLGSFKIADDIGDSINAPNLQYFRRYLIDFGNVVH